MAYLQVNFHSKALKKLVTFNALVPIDSTEEPVQNKTHGEPMKSLYLLHGYSGNYTDWISGTKIQELSEKYNVAVFMPSGENSFYLDDTDKGELFGDYVGNELIGFTRGLFPLSKRREDTFIGGFSMGGYGALRNGLKYADNFGGIIAFSSAIITHRIVGIPADYTDPIADYNYYKRVFGDLDQLLGSDKDPETLVINLKKKNLQVPNMFLACGTEDFLLMENRGYHDFLIANDIDHTYLESPGAHNWDFWNQYIEKSVLWMMKR